MFDFAVRVIKFCRQLPKSKEYDIIKNQLIKSATSSGANYEEAQGASSKADFVNKIKIALKEMRESNYWIRIIISIKETENELDFLLKESEELKKILGAISSKSNK
ncbi:MAG: four helix bundle protein [Ignavibacteriales bacterium]|nr:four helix bundle protein [Ignavibacteriales bacterium]